ncbi:MAG: Holliday junction resolvase RuvX [Armatimonadetes bacterium]|nr:Holliday junction resolvase RuvX [Armatimonadota bacterium]
MTLRTPAGRILALDMGSRRIGLAVCDETRTIASPLGAFARRTQGVREAVAAIRAAVEETGAIELVVGLPLTLDGEWGAQARKAAAFADLLRTQLGIPVHLQDERLTTFEADEALKEGRMGRAERQSRVDAVAASLILRSYLDTLGPRSEPGAPSDGSGGA